MHILSRKDLNAAELDTYGNDSDLLVGVQILEYTPPVLPLGKLFENH